jgi:hypothetical protein
MVMGLAEGNITMRLFITPGMKDAKSHKRGLMWSESLGWKGLKSTCLC